MNQNQIILLTKMKKLIKEGKRRFQQRKDRDITKDLLELGLTIEDALKEILYLNKNFYYIDNNPLHKQTKNILTFKN